MEPLDFEARINSGINIESATNPGFTDAYFSHPMEIAPMMAEYGLEELRLASADGITMLVEDKVSKLPANAFKKWVDMRYKLGTDPVTWGASEHMLYVGRKLL